MFVPEFSGAVTMTDIPASTSTDSALATMIETNIGDQNGFEDLLMQLCRFTTRAASPELANPLIDSDAEASVPSLLAGFERVSSSELTQFRQRVEGMLLDDVFVALSSLWELQSSAEPGPMFAVILAWITDASALPLISHTLVGHILQRLQDSSPTMIPHWPMAWKSIERWLKRTNDLHASSTSGAVSMECLLKSWCNILHVGLSAAAEARARFATLRFAIARLQSCCEHSSFIKIMRNRQDTMASLSVFHALLTLGDDCDSPTSKLLRHIWQHLLMKCWNPSYMAILYGQMIEMAEEKKPLHSWWGSEACSSRLILPLCRALPLWQSVAAPEWLLALHTLTQRQQQPGQSLTAAGRSLPIAEAGPLTLLSYLSLTHPPMPHWGCYLAWTSRTVDTDTDTDTPGKEAGDQEEEKVAAYLWKEAQSASPLRQWHATAAAWQLGACAPSLSRERLRKTSCLDGDEYGRNYALETGSRRGNGHAHANVNGRGNGNGRGQKRILWQLTQAAAQCQQAQVALSSSLVREAILLLNTLEGPSILRATILARFSHILCLGSEATVQVLLQGWKSLASVEMKTRLEAILMASGGEEEEDNAAWQSLKTQTRKYDQQLLCWMA